MPERKRKIDTEGASPCKQKNPKGEFPQPHGPPRSYGWYAKVAPVVGHADCERSSESYTGTHPISNCEACDDAVDGTAAATRQAKTVTPLLTTSCAQTSGSGPHSGQKKAIRVGMLVKLKGHTPDRRARNAKSCKVIERAGERWKVQVEDSMDVFEVEEADLAIRRGPRTSMQSSATCAAQDAHTSQDAVCADKVPPH